MKELELLLHAYEIKLKDIERDLGKELIKVTTRVNPVYGYTVINGQEIAYLQGQKFVLEDIIRELKESIKILTELKR